MNCGVLEFGLSLGDLAAAGLAGNHGLVEVATGGDELVGVTLLSVDEVEDVDETADGDRREGGRGHTGSSCKSEVEA